ncbi:MAG: carbonate dehydratase [Actinomycetia bacterium]|nr:carbonate dehydratase [Actinomycetes bacterium]
MLALVRSLARPAHVPEQKPHELMAANRAWAARMSDEDPDYFARLASQQSPTYLWIGCSDSRVPANQIVGLPPGEVFVHRNIANLVVPSDLNCLSVLQFAVEVLGVKHIIVTGHYGCGGIGAAIHNDRLGLVDNWLRHVGTIMRDHQAELEPLSDDEAQARLCEINVRTQVLNVGRTTIVQDAWSRGQELALHGWIYDIRDGLLRGLEADIAEPDALEMLTHRHQ